MRAAFTSMLLLALSGGAHAETEEEASSCRSHFEASYDHPQAGVGIITVVSECKPMSEDLYLYRLTIDNDLNAEIDLLFYSFEWLISMYPEAIGEYGLRLPGCAQVRVQFLSSEPMMAFQTPVSLAATDPFETLLVSTALPIYAPEASALSRPLLPAVSAAGLVQPRSPGCHHQRGTA